MEFSKNSIVSRHFSKRMLGGLDEFEVRDFLHVLAEEIRHLSQFITEQEHKISDQKKTIEEYRDREHLLKESISSAGEIATLLKKEAGDQGRLIVEKAQIQSESLVTNARHSLQSVYSDIADLKRLHLQFKTSLKASLQAQLEMVEQAPLLSQDLAHQEEGNFLEESSTSSHFQNQENVDSKPMENSFIEAGSSFIDSNPEISELKKQEEAFSKPTAFKEEGISSLKESLQNLDKDFF